MKSILTIEPETQKEFQEFIEMLNPEIHVVYPKTTDTNTQTFSAPELYELKCACQPIKTEPSFNGPFDIISTEEKAAPEPVILPREPAIIKPKLKSVKDDPAYIKHTGTFAPKKCKACETEFQPFHNRTVFCDKCKPYPASKSAASKKAKTHGPAPD
jgi:hypothetical protein